MIPKKPKHKSMNSNQSLFTPNFKPLACPPRGPHPVSYVRRLRLSATVLFAALAGLATQTRGQAVVEAWVQRYSNIKGSADVARKVVTDSSGNVIVLGNTDDFATPSGMLMIKYSAAGLPQWTNRS